MSIFCLDYEGIENICKSRDYRETNGRSFQLTAVIYVIFVTKLFTTYNRPDILGMWIRTLYFLMIDDIMTLKRGMIPKKEGNFQSSSSKISTGKFNVKVERLPVISFKDPFVNVQCAFGWNSQEDKNFISKLTTFTIFTKFYCRENKVAIQKW